MENAERIEYKHFRKIMTKHPKINQADCLKAVMALRDGHVFNSNRIIGMWHYWQLARTAWGMH